MTEHDGGHGHDHNKPAPVLVPFLLLWVAILVIWFIGSSQNFPIEGSSPGGVTMAGEGLAGAKTSTAAPSDTPESAGAAPATMSVPANYATP